MTRWRGLTALILTATAVGLAALTAVGILSPLAWPATVLLAAVALVLGITHRRRTTPVPRPYRLTDPRDRDDHSGWVR